MRRYLAVLLAVSMLLPIGLIYAAENDEGDWRRGRIYYRTTCTDCHKQMTGEGISPAEKTIAEWKAYLDANRHDQSGRTNPFVSYYVSQQYRETIRESNKVADKLIDLPDEALMKDVRAFLVHGASDSDNPTRCR
ncbi:MAG: hypothetical protein PVH09_07560 [Chromatiales bacterium]|jgi:hypothetical protein